jgi:hypothetical protein
MDQNEIDRIAQGIVGSSTTESKPAAPAVTEQAEPEAKTEMIDQLDKVTQVAEQETNKSTATDGIHLGQPGQPGRAVGTNEGENGQ